MMTTYYAIHDDTMLILTSDQTNTYKAFKRIFSLISYVGNFLNV